MNVLYAGSEIPRPGTPEARRDALLAEQAFLRGIFADIDADPKAKISDWTTRTMVAACLAIPEASADDETEFGRYGLALEGACMILKMGAERLLDDNTVRFGNNSIDDRLHQAREQTTARTLHVPATPSI